MLSIKTVPPALGKCKRQKWGYYDKKVLDVERFTDIIIRSRVAGKVCKVRLGRVEYNTEKYFGGKITIKKIWQAASSIFSD